MTIVLTLDWRAKTKLVKVYKLATNRIQGYLTIFTKLNITSFHRTDVLTKPLWRSY